MDKLKLDLEGKARRLLIITRKNKSAVAYLSIVALLVIIIVTGICNQSHHHNHTSKINSDDSYQQYQIQRDKNRDELQNHQEIKDSINSKKHIKYASYTPSSPSSNEKKYQMSTPAYTTATPLTTTLTSTTFYGRKWGYSTTSTTAKTTVATSTMKLEPKTTKSPISLPPIIIPSGPGGLSVCSKSKVFKSCLLSLTRYTLDPELSNFCPTHTFSHQNTIVSTLRALIDKFNLKNREKNTGLWGCLSKMSDETSGSSSSSSNRSLTFGFQAIIEAIARFNNKMVFPFAFRIASEFGRKSHEFFNLPQYLQWVGNGTEVRIAFMEPSLNEYQLQQRGHSRTSSSRLFYFYQKSTQSRDRDRFAWALRSSPHFQPGNRIFSFRFEPSEGNGGSSGGIGAGNGGAAGVYIRNTRYNDYVVMDIENENLIFSQSHMPFEVVWMGDNLFQLVFGARAFFGERLDTSNVTSVSEWERIDNYKFRRGRNNLPANFILEHFN